MGVRVVAIEAGRGFVERKARQQRHAVESLLSVGDHVVAKRFHRLARKRLVDAFDLLQAGDIRRGLAQPGEQVVEALAHRIDVPGGDPHGSYPVGNRPKMGVCRIP